MNPALAPRELTKAATSDARLSARIVIVDGNPSSLKPATDALELSGYVVEHACDEGQLQAILGHAIPNLILLDLALPGIDNLARSLRTDRRCAHVPLVALAHPTAAGRDDAARQVSDGCIVRPLDARKLPLQIAAFLVRGAGHRPGLPATRVA